MKYLYALLLLFGLNVVYSQVITVKDATAQEPVPFATILFVQEGMPVAGDYCEQDGKFTMPADEVFNTVEVSCIGYAPKVIAKADITPIILLTKTAVELTEVVVTKTLPKKGLVLGYSDFKKSFVSGIGKGIEEVVFIENMNNKPLEIVSFLFSIKKAKAKTAFRIHFYNISPENFEPGAEILIHDVINYIDAKTKGLVEIDVTGLNLELPAEGAFVGIEALGVIDETTGNFIMDPEKGNIRFEYNNQIDKPVTFIRNRFKVRTWQDTTRLKSALNNNSTNYPNASFGLKVVR